MRYYFKPDSKNQYVMQKPRNLGDSLESFALEMWELVYSRPYAAGKPRIIHGMAHVTRAAILGRVGYNLMRMAKVEGVDTLPAATYEEEAKLIEIALLLHDSGAESDDKDVHDNDNALNIYDYLTNRLSIPHETAKRVAEAARNKDWTSGALYYELHLDAEGNPFFQEAPHYRFSIPPDVNRLRLAIQYGDGVDYLRTHNPFDIRYLQLYQEYKDNDLICEASQRMLIEDRRLCDAFHEAMGANEKAYNGSKAYSFIIEQMNAAITTDIDEKKAPCMKALYLGQVTEIDLQQMFHREKSGDDVIDAFYTFDPSKNEALLLRGINKPNKYFRRVYDTKDYSGLTQSGYERYKIDRRPGGESLSIKNKTQEKTGNPLRSMSFAAPGAMVFTGVGLGILMRDDHVMIASAASKDAGTGYGKKEYFIRRADSQKTDKTSRDIQRIQALIREGGGDQEHTEITGTIFKYDAIIYTLDKTYSTQDKGSPAIRFLLAVFLHHEIYQSTKTALPIYECSCENAYIKKITVTPELVVEAFQNAVRYIVRRAMLISSDITHLQNTDSITLLNEFMGKDAMPLYQHFPADLKARVLSSMTEFNEKKNAFILDLLGNFEPVGSVYLDAKRSGGMLEFMLFRIPVRPTPEESAIITNALNLWRDTRPHEYNNKNVFETLAKLARSDAYQALVKATFIKWIFDPRNAPLAHNKVAVFETFVKEANFKLNEEAKKRIEALTKVDIDEAAVFNNAREAKLKPIERPVDAYTFPDDVPVDEMLQKANEWVDQINETNKTMSFDLMKLLEGIVFRSQDPAVMSVLQTILKKMKKNLSIPIGSTRDLLYFAIKMEIKEAIQMIAPVAISGVSEGIQFIETLPVDEIGRLDLIELVTDSIKDEKVIDRLQERLLYLACDGVNVKLVEAMLASKNRDHYINAVSLSYKKISSFDSCTALDAAIEAMRNFLVYMRDEVSENEYKRWMNVVFQLLEMGASVCRYGDIDKLKILVNLPQWKLLVRVLLQRIDPPKVDKSLADQIEYLYISVRSGYIGGIAYLIRSGAFFNIIEGINARFERKSVPFIIYIDHIIREDKFNFGNAVVFDKYDIPVDLYRMFSDMNCFFKLEPIVTSHGSALLLTKKQISWLTSYTEEQPALACALIDFQFQLMDHDDWVSDKYVAKNDFLWSVVGFAAGSQHDRLFASLILDNAIALFQEHGKCDPDLLIRLRGLEAIHPASLKDVKSVVYNRISANERGVFMLTEESTVVSVEEPVLLKVLLSTLPSPSTLLEKQIFACILMKVGEALFEHHDTLNSGREILALYNACVRHQHFPDLSALKRRVLELAMDSGDPEAFFKKNGEVFFPLLNHQTRLVPHIREWFKSESEMQNSPSTHTARLVDTFVNPSATAQDKENAIRQINTLLGREPASAIPTATSSNNKPSGFNH